VASFLQAFPLSTHKQRKKKKQQTEREQGKQRAIKQIDKKDVNDEKGGEGRMI
jgi:hypothetical protein